MITANQKKFVKSLIQKKFRNHHQCFIVEGVKLVEELLASDYEVHSIYATEEWAEKHLSVNAIIVSKKDLASISSLKTPNEVLAVVKQKTPVETDAIDLILAIDFIQDPGNLGTIIRTADWFGINHILCSTDSVDVYNPKVIQASMGSIFRVDVKYKYLAEFFESNPAKKVYGALLEGEPITSETKFSDVDSVLLLGNESKGISDQLKPFITHPVSIPRKGGAESLNVAAAAAILCAKFNRI